MSDTITLPGTNEIVATVDRASVQYQVVMLDYQTQADAAIAADSTSTVGGVLTLYGAKRVALQVDLDSGSVGSLVTTIQVSADNVTYHNSAGTVTGEGIVEIDTGFAYARAAVTTAGTGGAFINTFLQVK